MKKIFLIIIIISCGIFVFAQTGQENLLNKIYKVKKEDESVVKQQTMDRQNLDQDYPIQTRSSQISKILPFKRAEEKQSDTNKTPSPTEQITPQVVNQDLQQPATPSAKEIPTQETQSNSSSENKEEPKIETKPEEKTENKAQPKEETQKTIKKEPASADPAGVDWIALSKGKLNVKMQRRTKGISTPNLSMKFNNVYQSLFRNIPWLMGGKAKVYVYQNRHNFLDHEPVASDWSGAFFSPENNRIVMYDEPDNTDKMLSQFQHELTHLFVENFFCPPGSGKPEPPIWLNEGLAVNMEDISQSAAGNVWANDLVVLNMIPAPKSPAASLRASRPITKASSQFLKFSDFVKNDSYDSAVAAGKMEDWYMQAYAMIRFLFKPYNNQYPEKRIQFEYLTKLLNSYENKKDSKGRLLKDEQGRQIKTRTTFENALKKAYGYNSIDDFEMKFWQWLYAYQKEQREKLNN